MLTHAPLISIWIYFSIETMHREQKTNPWFQVEIIPKTMEILGHYFFFDVETLPEVLNAQHVVMASKEESIIQSHVLIPK